MKETLKIEGMSCGGCVHSVQQALDRLPIEKMQVYVGGATVEYDEEKVTHQQIVRIITAVGYDVIEQESRAHAQ